MKQIFTFLVSATYCLQLTAQTPLTGMVTTDVASSPATTYVNGGNTYNWAVGANNIQKRITTFSSAAGSFTYSSALNGVVKMRRIDNAKITGDFTLVWSEGTTGAAPFTMQAPMPANMEAYFDDNVYNKGTDNFFDNVSANSNNIERMDWILVSGYSTNDVNKIGFAIFERGNDNAHDPFIIAPITGVDASGNPNNYGALKQILSTNYGNIASSGVSYRIAKGASGSNLLDATANTQNRGGVFISFADLGITAGTTIYGYSIFPNDVPITSTVAQLLDVSATNSVTYPTNTGGAGGGIDLIATTGIFIDVTVLPIKLEAFSVEQKNYNELKWIVADVENELQDFEVQKSNDGINFTTIGTVSAAANKRGYSYNDDVTVRDCMYRIKIKKRNASFFYSDIIKIVSSGVVAGTVTPNPVKNTCTINYKATNAGEVIVAVFDITGKQVCLEKKQTLKGLNTLKINGVANLNAGQYVVKILKDLKINTVFKLLKE
jgi:hypothetical protein